MADEAAIEAERTRTLRLRAQAMRRSAQGSQPAVPQTAPQPRPAQAVPDQVVGPAVALSGPVASDTVDAADYIARVRGIEGGETALTRRDDPSAARQLAGDVFNSPFNQGPIGRVMGEEDGAQLTRNVVESGTLGTIGDEAFAAFDAAVGRGSYDERLEFYRNRQEEFRDDNPMISFASEIAPALVPGLGGAKLVQQLTSRLGRSGAGAVLGGLAASLYGGMEGEGGASERAANAATAGTLGALFGAAAPRITETLANVPSRVARVFQRSQERPTLETLKAAKNVAYQAVDQAREAFTGDDMRGLSQRVAAIFDAENYVEEVDDAARATLRILDRRAGQDTTLSQLDGIRQNLWSRYTRASDQPVILDAIREIDNLIDSRAGASELMQVARAANRRYSNAQLLEDAFTRAERQTSSTGSGGNILNKYRQAVTSILSNPRKARFFNADEIALMDSFVRGSTSENLRRLVGKLSPNGNGLMMALHTIGGVASGGLSVPLMMVGAGAKGSADRAAMRGANFIQDVVSGARPARLPAPAMTPSGAAATTSAAAFAAQQAPGARNALARLPIGGR